MRSDLANLAKTLLHLEAKKDGLDLECVDYWMGYVTDPNRYDKFYRDKNYTLEQYRIAEKYLNIISGSYTTSIIRNSEQLVDQIIKNKATCEILVNALAEKIGAKLVPAEK